MIDCFAFEQICVLEHVRTTNAFALNTDNFELKSLATTLI